jgi:hypothetical protein
LANLHYDEHGVAYRRSSDGRQLYLISKGADGVTRIRRLKPAPQLLARDRFTCPCCLGDFTAMAFADGKIVLETIGPVSDGAAS